MKSYTLLCEYRSNYWFVFVCARIKISSFFFGGILKISFAYQDCNAKIFSQFSRNNQLIEGKFLGISEIRRNGALSSHIHGRSHYKFNEWIPLWMWEERTPFSTLQECLRTTLKRDCLIAKKSCKLPFLFNL